MRLRWSGSFATIRVQSENPKAVAGQERSRSTFRPFVLTHAFSRRALSSRPPPKNWFGRPRRLALGRGRAAAERRGSLPQYPPVPGYASSRLRCNGPGLGSRGLLGFADDGNWDAWPRPCGSAVAIRNLADGRTWSSPTPGEDRANSYSPDLCTRSLPRAGGRSPSPWTNQIQGLPVYQDAKGEEQSAPPPSFIQLPCRLIKAEPGECRERLSEDTHVFRGWMDVEWRQV